MRSPTPPSAAGKPQASSAPRRPPEVIAGTAQRTLHAFLVRKEAEKEPKEEKEEKEETIAMPGSHPATSEPILTGKLNISSPKPLQIPSSSKISDQGSIGTAQASRGFWDSHMTERSHQLPLPTKTGCVDLPIELVGWIFAKAGVKLVVLGQGEDHNPDPERELADDLLAVTNHFVAKK